MSTIKANAIIDAAGGNTATINGITPALSSQAQAQAGTDNTTQMTPLRTSDAITALTTPTVVGAAMAGLTAGDVGDYSFLFRTGTTAYAYGSTLAGSSLQPSNAAPNVSGFVSGTWRCLGYVPSGSTSTGAVTLWRRIS